MLPSNILPVTVGRGWIKPRYAMINSANRELAESLIATFTDCQGERKRLLITRLKGFEEIGHDYKFIRGLGVLLERRCLFESPNSADPVTARRIVFHEASRSGLALTGEKRSAIFAEASKAAGMESEQLEDTLWSDLEEELVLKNFREIDPLVLLRYYNLSLVQTLLFKAVKMEFSVGGAWKEIFRAINRYGLMYSAEVRENGFHVVLDGPLSLFKLTDRYGTSLAKLLPVIMQGEDWSLNATVVRKSMQGKRMLDFKLDRLGASGLLEDIERPTSKDIFDSKVEERFSRSFNSLGTEWKCIREPEPLITGSHVLIPDFSFEKSGLKVYLEIMGFWTEDYIERKIRKLRQLSRDVEMIVAVDEALACTKLTRMKHEVIMFRGSLPVKPIINYLNQKEARQIDDQVNAGKAISIRSFGLGEIVSVKDVATSNQVSPGLVQKAAFDGGAKIDDFILIGDQFISSSKVSSIDRAIKASNEVKLQSLSALLLEEGILEPIRLLEYLHYVVRWKGLDFDQAVVSSSE